MRLLSIGETAAELGVAVGTLQHWHRQGLLMSFGLTVGGHRRYQCATVAGDSRVTVWRGVHAAYRGVVRGQRLATRGRKSRRSAIDTTGDGSNTVLLSRDYLYLCDNNL